MSRQIAPLPPANVRLSQSQPAYLEVTVDPAAHGERGLGPIQRAVLLKTANGQELRFELAAHIMP
jgi:hypothetical protein